MKALLLRMKTKGPFGFCSGGAINHGTVALPRQLAETQVSQKEQSESKIAERSGFDGKVPRWRLRYPFFLVPENIVASALLFYFFCPLSFFSLFIW